MADEAYYRWVKAGKPYNLALPLVDHKACLQRHGYTVWDYPDEAHQKADPAQDHTAYSETGWPLPSPEWWGHAVDIPQITAGQRSKVNGLPLPPIEVLSAQIVKDRKANHPGIAWLKYINRPASSAIWSQPFYQERFQPDYDRRISADYGHMHESCRTDWTRKTTEATRAYDPVARAQGVDMARTLTDEDLDALATAVWLRAISSPAMGVVNRAAADWLKAGAGAQEDIADLDAEVDADVAAEEARDQSLAVRITGLENALAELLARPAAGQVDPAQIAAAIKLGVDAALRDPEVLALVANATLDEEARRLGA